jgi:hypothetical protein
MGLRQRNGGPCGVLAPVQARVLSRLYFDTPADLLALPSPVLGTPVLPAPSGAAPVAGLTPPTVVERRTALVHALATIVLQAGNRGPLTPPCGIFVTYRPAVAGAACSISSGAADFQLQSFVDLPSAVEFVSAHLRQFETPAGVMLLVMSVVLSRGIEQVKVCDAQAFTCVSVVDLHLHAIPKTVCMRSKAWRSRKRVAAALTSPARHACGCARPSRARFGHRGSNIMSDGSLT